MNKFSDKSRDLKNSYFPDKESEYLFREKENSREIFLNEDSQLEKNTIGENFNFEFINKQKEKLKNIDLIEKNYEELYGWKSLFCKSRPISCYSQVKNLKTIQKFEENKNIKCDDKNIKNNQGKEVTEIDTLDDDSNKNSLNKKYKNPFRENNNLTDNINNELKVKRDRNKSDFVFPIALIDEHEDKINEFITIPRNVSQRRKKMENFQIKSKVKKNISKSKIINTLNQNKSLRHSFSINNSDLITKKHDENIQVSLTSGFYSMNKTNKNTQNRLSHSVSILNRKKNDKNLAIRPMSVYSKRSDSAVFYLSKDFSDYFKQSLKEFSDKFSLLHPKIKCDNSKIKKLLDEIKTIQDEDEKLIKSFKNIDDFFNIKDLNLAGNSKNIFPLLKTYIKKSYNDQDVSRFFSDKTYPVSNKSSSNKNSGFDYNKQLNKTKSKDPKSNNDSDFKDYKLQLDTYQLDDPDLKIFSDHLEELSQEYNNDITVQASIKDQDKQNFEDFASNISQRIDSVRDNASQKDFDKIDFVKEPLIASNLKDSSTGNSYTSIDLKENKNLFEDPIVKKTTVKNKNFGRPKTAANKKDYINNSISKYLIFRTSKINC